MAKMLIDINKTGNKINPVWNFGFNTCHAALHLRDDLPSQVSLAKECNFKYIRFHHNFSEAVGIYTENEKGESVYNFDNFDKIYDKAIKNGMLPFMEIGFCPESLKVSDKTLMAYKASTSKPKSYEKWAELIKKLVSHCIERYGINCVKKWYFEVWNEPDIIFFDGNMEDYFELYDHTALAIKSVDESLKVGGPATSKCAWVADFIKHIENGSQISGFKSLPCDFISTHAYPSDLPFFTKAHGDVQLLNSSILYEMYSMVRKTMDNSSLKKLPLIMGEWNSSAGPLAFNHDEKNNAAFIVKTLNDLKYIIDGSLYWNLSDINEEVGFHYAPFHGGYGLFNVNDIPKSSYNAFKLLNMIKGDELVTCMDDEQKDGRGVLASFDNDNKEINILLYHYVEPDSKESGPWNVSIDISGVQSETVSYKSYAISDNGGSSYEWWLKMGSPEYLNPEKMQFLYEKSVMPEENKILFIDKALKTYTLNETLYPGDVKLIRIFNI